MTRIKRPPIFFEQLAQTRAQCDLWGMKRINLAVMVVAAISTSCANPPDREAIMDEIEKNVTLPRDAQAFELYGRNYAFHGPEQVRAAYYIPRAPLTEKMGCYVGGKPCSKDYVRKLMQDNAAERARHAAAGQRRWFETERDLPALFDGGCSIIHIKYEIATRRILSVSCNGFP
jgi:hypothetical protein